MIERILNYLRPRFMQQATIGELAAELRIRRPGETRPERRKTRKGATHKHSEPGQGMRRRSYLPWILGIAKRRFRPSCRFVYARKDKQLSREPRMRVIRNNDRIENAIQARRIEMRGTRIAVG